MAFDDAANAAYAGNTWVTGQNGGYGFGPWAFTPAPNTAQGGFFIGNSSLNAGGASGNINTSGVAWGMYHSNGPTAEAIRSFTPGGTNGLASLGIGEKFILRMDNGFINTNGAVGFSLLNSIGEKRFEFFFTGGQSTYTIRLGTDLHTVHGFTGDGMSAEFTLTSPDTFQFDLTFATGSPVTETFTGTLNFTAGSGIEQFRLFNFGSGGGSNADVFYNSIAVVPEPGCPVLMALGAALVGVFRKRTLSVLEAL